MKQNFQLNVNGRIFGVNCDPSRTLLDVIREDLRFTGTKRGCDIGVCGTCTVLVDGKPRRACRVKIKDVAIAGSGTEPPLTLPSPLRGEGQGEGAVASHVPRPSSLVHITTIEGLEQSGQLHPIQQAFIDCGAIQCGFCTPGMVLQAKALLDENPNPTRDEIRKALAANLCRCTGYQQIFDAIEEAARRMKSSSL